MAYTTIGKSTVTHHTKEIILLTLIGLSVAFWLLALVGTVLLLQEVNSQLRPKRLALLSALSVRDVTPQGRVLQKVTNIGIVGFLAGLFLCLAVKNVL